jgi:hypothetical protein
VLWLADASARGLPGLSSRVRANGTLAGVCETLMPDRGSQAITDRASVINPDLSTAGLPAPRWRTVDACSCDSNLAVFGALRARAAATSAATGFESRLSAAPIGARPRGELV